jgi:hypothetical protein
MRCPACRNGNNEYFQFYIYLYFYNIDIQNNIEKLEVQRIFFLSRTDC